MTKKEQTPDQIPGPDLSKPAAQTGVGEPAGPEGQAPPVDYVATVPKELINKDTDKS